MRSIANGSIVSCIPHAVIISFIRLSEKGISWWQCNRQINVAHTINTATGRRNRKLSLTAYAVLSVTEAYRQS